MTTPIIIVVAIGLVCAAILTIASKVFFVPVDETFSLLREALPGANCGGCGYAGCDDYAQALTDDHDTPCNKCPVGGPGVAAKLAEILGVEAGEGEKTVAVVQCDGNCKAKKSLMDYEGMETCMAAKQFFGGVNECAYGCIGLGDCENVCDYEAIKVIDGVAVVNRDNCVACGMCSKACPNSLIRISPAKNIVVVQCSSKAKGAQAKKECANACIGCGLCEKACKFDSIHVENNLAFIDPEKCKNCGMCAKVCPTGAILNMRLTKQPYAPLPLEMDEKFRAEQAEKKKAEAAAKAAKAKVAKEAAQQAEA